MVRTVQYQPVMVALMASIDDDIPAPTSLQGTGQPLAVGEVIGGQFEVTQLIGVGSMGHVYRAADLRLGRDVAIKASVADPNSTWLCAEGRALARLRDPRIVGIHTLGADRGLVYLVMDLVRGTTAGRLRRAGPLPVDDVLSILEDTARALSAVHGAGLVHRDVKPDNIVRTPDGETVLLDLGVCATPERMAAENRAIGSPYYFSPEVIVGEVTTERAHLADIYSLGVTAFELVAGRPPFWSRDITQLLTLHVTQAPPLLSERASDAPPELERLVTEMLRKDPRDRPPNAEFVATWLRRLQRNRRAAACDVQVLVASASAETRHMLASAVDVGLISARIQTATDGDAALRILERGNVDVAVVDLDLPGTPGLEIARRVASNGACANTTVVITDSAPSSHVCRRAARHGVACILDTQSSAAALADRLLSVLAAARGPRRLAS